ncbi:MAG: nuclear transport factor 2 family protein [Crocinitomicaceae bacterium]|nr:nuclear transport factor 2 family protein [Crocinitomicaceae bacterium]
MDNRTFIANWVNLFNQKNADGLAELYTQDAINHQVANETITGKDNICAMFKREFATAEMVCIIEKIYSDQQWAILEWRDPLGLRGCTLFHIVNQKIVFQRGYWDQLSFLRQHGLPIPQK